MLNALRQPLLIGIDHAVDLGFQPADLRREHRQLGMNHEHPRTGSQYRRRHNADDNFPFLHAHP